MGYLKADEAHPDDVFEEFVVELVYHRAARTGLLSLLETAVNPDVKCFDNAFSLSVAGRPYYVLYEEEDPNHLNSLSAVRKLV